MREFIVLSFCFVVFSIYLIFEKVIINKKIQRIPLRILVTGTRGKSTVTRLIAFSLKEAGIRILAKTTGSKPIIIYPDGKEEEIKRKGLPSILEGKKIIRTAEKLKVDALITEMMSINPECGFIESEIFNPHILVITNVRIDHTAQMGETKEDIAKCFASYIPSNCNIFILEEEFYSIFKIKAEKLNSKLIKIPQDSLTLSLMRKFSSSEFEENIRLVWGVCNFIGINEDKFLKGIKNTKRDFGHIKAWVLNSKLFPRECYLVNCFAVNDPESTKNAFSYLKSKGLLRGRKAIGILNLRKDRGDRSLQWLNALKKREFLEFQEFYFIGEHSYFLKRKLNSLNVPIFVEKHKNPQKIMSKIFEKEKEDLIIIGMGNIGGMGERFVSYWERIGQAYDF